MQRKEGNPNAETIEKHKKYSDLHCIWQGDGGQTQQIKTPLPRHIPVQQSQYQGTQQKQKDPHPHELKKTGEGETFIRGGGPEMHQITGQRELDHRRGHEPEEIQGGKLAHQGRFAHKKNGQKTGLGPKRSDPTIGNGHQGEKGGQQHENHRHAICGDMVGERTQEGMLFGQLKNGTRGIKQEIEITRAEQFQGGQEHGHPKGGAIHPQAGHPHRRNNREQLQASQNRPGTLLGP